MTTATFTAPRITNHTDVESAMACIRNLLRQNGSIKFAQTCGHLVRAGFTWLQAEAAWNALPCEVIE